MPTADKNLHFRILRRDLIEHDVVYIDNDRLESALMYLAEQNLPVVTVDRGSYSAVSLIKTRGKAARRA